MILVISQPLTSAFPARRAIKSFCGGGKRWKLRGWEDGKVGRWILKQFYNSLPWCRALTQKRMKTNTTELRSIVAPLAEGPLAAGGKK